MIDIRYENGKIVHNGQHYTAIKELDKKLTELGVPHDFHELYDGYQICVPKNSGNCFEGDAVQHFGSYGARRNLLEVWGFDLNDPAGYLTVEQALVYFVDWWKKKGGVVDE